MYPELCPECRNKVDKALKDETAKIFNDIDKSFGRIFAKCNPTAQRGESSNNKKDLETPLNNLEISTNCLE